MSRATPAARAAADACSLMDDNDHHADSKVIHSRTERERRRVMMTMYTRTHRRESSYAKWRRCTIYRLYVQVSTGRLIRL